MKKFNDKILGDVILYKDYIKMVGVDDYGQIYRQSNTKLQGYGDRTVAICKFTGKLLVAVAINYNPTPDSDKSVVYPLKHRLHTILQRQFDILPEDNGFTYVPEEWASLLWKDRHTYGILHGMLDPGYAQMIIKELNAVAK